MHSAVKAAFLCQHMSDSTKNITIGIVDYEMGNIRSAQNALARIGCSVYMAQNAADFNKADALILPGVGAFGEAMETLRRLKLIEPLLETVSSGKPILGICLGMQLLADSSEERGIYTGLSLIPGTVKLIPTPNGLRLPHVGWNTVQIRNNSPLFGAECEGEAFSFVPSYHFVCSNDYIVVTTENERVVVAAVQKDHVFGVQFHPERSQTGGLRVLKQFVQYTVERN